MLRINIMKKYLIVNNKYSRTTDEFQQAIKGLKKWPENKRRSLTKISRLYAGKRVLEYKGELYENVADRRAETNEKAAMLYIQSAENAREKRNSIN